MLCNTSVQKYDDIHHSQSYFALKIVLMNDRLLFFFFLYILICFKYSNQYN